MSSRIIVSEKISGSAEIYNFFTPERRIGDFGTGFTSQQKPGPRRVIKLDSTELKDASQIMHQLNGIQNRLAGLMRLTLIVSQWWRTHTQLQDKVILHQRTIHPFFGIQFQWGAHDIECNQNICHVCEQLMVNWMEHMIN